MDPRTPHSILITGASSGIGAALAREYAGPGITLHLGGRDRERLDAVAADARVRGADVRVHICDVTDRQGMAGWIAAAFTPDPVDLVIANAGVSGGSGGGEPRIPTPPVETAGQAVELLHANVDGVVNTIFPAIEAMAADREAERSPAAPGLRGQIAIVSSLAGFRGLPGAPVYCASKAALRSLGEGLRPRLIGRRIGVSVICPGFVKSPMTDPNPFPMPLLMSSEKAARIIRRGLARNRARIAFPRRLYALVWLISALPPAWTDRILQKMPDKPAR